MTSALAASTGPPLAAVRVISKGDPGVAPDAGSSAHRAHPYQIISNSVIHLQTFEESDADISLFGQTVDIYSDYILISDPQYDDISQPLDNIGKSFLYEKQNGSYSAPHLLPSISKDQPANADQLGQLFSLVQFAGGQARAGAGDGQRSLAQRQLGRLDGVSLRSPKRSNSLAKR